jgi:hypothetical protein
VTLLKRAAALLIVVLGLSYLATPVYRFPSPQKFTGASLWNPYANMSGMWQLANLHAHGRAWGGLTNGWQPDAEVVQAYEQRGYTVAGISNYHSIAGLRGVPTLPIYEHGYNVLKHHQLAIGAHDVDWFDIPLWQGVNQMQYVMDRVKRTADLVAIAHPSTAYSADDLRRLTGYQLFELVNGPFWADALWDAALSSGHAVWAIANDDTHDVTDPRRMAVAWTMIDAPSANAADVIPALRAGRMYAVSAPTGRPVPPEATLSRVNLHGSTLEVSSDGSPATYAFIGQDGVVRKKVEATNSASYSLSADDTYIRTEIRTERTAMFLNPIVRYDGVGLDSPEPVVNAAGTWGQRLLIAVSCFVLVRVLWKRPRGSRA